MAMMKLDTSIGNVIDPTRGMQNALTNISTIMTQADKMKQLELKNARQAKADQRAELLFGQQQDEYSKKLSNRDALNAVATTWTPGNGNAEHIEPLQNTIADKYNVANKKAEDRIKALGLSADAGDGDKIGKIYDEEMWGNVDPVSKTAAMQRIFDNNKMDKDYASRQILQDYANAGGTDAVQGLALAKQLTGDLLTRDQMLAQEQARAKAINEAVKAKIDNRLKIAELRIKSDKVANDGKSKALKGSSKEAQRSKAKWMDVADAYKALDESPVTGGWLAHPDATTGKEVIQAVLAAEPKTNPADVVNFLNADIDFGAVDNTYNGKIDISDDDGRAATVAAFKKYMGEHSSNGSKQLFDPQTTKIVPEDFTYTPAVATTLSQLDKQQLSKAEKELNSILNSNTNKSDKNPSIAVAKHKSKLQEHKIPNPLKEILKTDDTKALTKVILKYNGGKKGIDMLNKLKSQLTPKELKKLSVLSNSKEVQSALDKKLNPNTSLTQNSKTVENANKVNSFSTTYSALKHSYDSKINTLNNTMAKVYNDPNLKPMQKKTKLSQLAQDKVYLKNQLKAAKTITNGTSLDKLRDWFRENVYMSQNEYKKAKLKDAEDKDVLLNKILNQNK